KRHRIGAVDRYHHDIEPADGGEMALVELVVQMAEMADAQARDLENEDRVAVLDHLAAGTLAVIAADVGGDVADIDVVDAQADKGGLPVIAPAMEHMLDLRIG